MLEHLWVKDFAIIDSVDLDIPEGLVIFTGETGAGKSLIVGAIDFLFGGKADQSLIREGAQECSVAGVISIDKNPRAIDWIESREMLLEDGRVTLRRGLKDSGRTYAYIQGQPVTRGDLAEFTSLVADIHGQHEHQTLMDASKHLFLLDAYTDLDAERKEFSSIYASYLAISRELKKASAEAEQKEARIEALEFSISDIEKARLKEDEDDELLAEERRLSQHEKLYQAVSSISSAFLGSGEESVLHSLRKVKSDFETAKAIDPKLNELSDRLKSAYFELEDISESIHDYEEKLRFDPLRLEEIETRLAEIRRLKKKYGATILEILKRRDADKKLLETLRDVDDAIAKLRSRRAEIYKTALERAHTLSSKRRTAALSLSGKITTILRGLGMPLSKFDVSLINLGEEDRVEMDENGSDKVEFTIAPNPGEPSKPLVKIASGGELSRIALAIKSVLAANDKVDTMIFDEIDTGIGGEVAVSVSSHMKELSTAKQILCVTHLAILAARATSQFLVEKLFEDGRTRTTVKRITGKDRESEIARMLAGDKESAASLAHAIDLIDRFKPTN